MVALGKGTTRLQFSPFSLNLGANKPMEIADDIITLEDNGSELLLANIPNDELSIRNQHQRRYTLHPANNQDIEGSRASLPAGYLSSTYFISLDIVRISM